MTDSNDELLLQISVQKRHLNAAAKQVKSINDMGRSAVKDETKLITFKGWFKALERYFIKFETLWENIDHMHERLNPRVEFPSEKELDIKNAVTNYYFECLASNELILSRECKIVAPDPVKMPSTSTFNSTFNESRCNKSLPKINLPHFDGQILNWPKFKDLFTALVHDDANLTNIEKFHYLATSLTNSASSIIAQLPISDANYPVAWKALNDNFDKKRIIASAYLNQLSEFKPIQGKMNLESLQFFLNTVCENIAAFKSLKITNESDFILFHLSLKCLDQQTREQFESSIKGKDFPTFDDLVSFCRDKCLTFQLVNPSISQETNKANFNPKNKSFHTNRKTVLLTNNPSSASDTLHNISSNKLNEKKANLIPCVVCQKGSHALKDCNKFSNLSPFERFNSLKGFSGCRNCLSYSHKTTDCNSKGHCKLCSKKHNSLLHLSFQTNNTEPSKGNSNDQTQPSISTICQIIKPSPYKSTDLNLNVVHNSEPENKILLATAVAEILDGAGQYQKIRMVIDSGSQNSFITQNCWKKLGLNLNHYKKPISGIGQTIFDGTIGRTYCVIRPRHIQTSKTLSTHALVVKNITSFLPNFSISKELCSSYFKYRLADPDFYKSSAIDFLAGADLISEIMNGAPFAISDCLPKLFPSIFGNLIMGKFSTQSMENSSSLLTLLTTDNLNENLKRFWELEEVPSINPVKLTEEELACEEHFKNNYTRDPDGRYVVRLPFKSDDICLPDTAFMAEKRLLNLEAKFNKNKNLRVQYCKFMHEYETLNHMNTTNNPSKFIIPHHSVTKEDRNELKLRVVFDASASVHNESLNSHLMVGAKLQRDISQILLNFRAHQVAIATDIVKMYRNIALDPRDRPYQHILWRFEPNNKIKKYELNTVTYGLTSAPFLALRTILQLCEDEGKKFSHASTILKRDMYVDDIVTGCDTVVDALKLKNELIQLLSCGQFALSKWASNRPEILNSINEKVNNEPISLTSSEDLTIKILGLQWDPQEDSFTYKVDLPTLSNNKTKRSILSTIAKLYDPIGLVTPTLMVMKNFMQELWKQGFDWDQQISPELEKIWANIINDLPSLSKLKIPRFLGTFDLTTCQFIGFCDASEKGYCATIYVKVKTSNDIKINLLTAKTKVSPAKTISIPRLELCAALLLAKLYTSTAPFRELIKCHQLTPYFFTDSEIVLSWLKIPEFKLKTFVANRVGEIINLLPNGSWKHVKSKDNPSDAGSRGQLPSQLIANKLWWHGPPWLNCDEENWPKSHFMPKPPPELKHVSTSLVTILEVSYFINWMERFSSYYKLLRSMAWTLRFKHNCLFSKSKRQGTLTLSEILNAKTVCIKLVQLHYFLEGSIENQEALKKKFSNLNLFLDSQGLFRVGGRLENSNLSFNHKHPILLPPEAHFTKLLVYDYHLSYQHPGPSLLLALIRTQFWVPTLNRLVRATEFKCLKCYKAKAKTVTPLMANLPSSRFNTGHPFGHVGIDFAGPFTMRESLRRKAPLSNVYCCVFICLSTKALHLEAVTRLTTESFIDSLDRFIARRGLPSDIYSDCGTNFVGACNLLTRWYHHPDTQTTMLNYGVRKNIHWHFNPPHTPHFGGLWERAVRSFKRIFILTAGDTPITYEEFATLLSKIEAILNSRPLCPLSTSPDNLDFLSPGHFLIGRPLVAIPEPTLCDVKESTLSRWQLLKRMSEHFWNRWHLEYLSTRVGIIRLKI